MPQISRACKGCGDPIYRTAQKAPIPWYHGDDCRPRCCFDGCESPAKTRDWCTFHYTRWKSTGDPSTPLVRLPNVGLCSVEGCDQPMRKRDWCAGHYSQWRRFGEVRPFAYKWAVVGQPCVICAKPTGVESGRRKVCSDICQQILFRHGGPPANPDCARCGTEIDLLAGKNGRRVHVDVKLCKRCRAQRRTEATVGELALRDGPFCCVCGCDVDLLAESPDPMRPSVDHTVPMARGGSDAAENNGLTHLLCNLIKSDRIWPPYTAALP